MLSALCQVPSVLFVDPLVSSARAIVARLSNVGNAAIGAHYVLTTNEAIEYLQHNTMPDIVSVDEQIVLSDDTAIRQIREVFPGKIVILPMHHQTYGISDYGQDDVVLPEQLAVVVQDEHKHHV